MVLPQKFRHLAGLHGSVDTDGRGLWVPLTVLTDD
jgi:hypothetical protein